MNGYPSYDDAAPRSRYRLWLRCVTGADDTSWGLAFAAFTLSGDAADDTIFDFGSEYIAWDSEEFSRGRSSRFGCERSDQTDHGVDHEGLAGFGISSSTDERIGELV